MAKVVTGNAANALNVYQALFGQSPGSVLYPVYVSEIASSGASAWAQSMVAGFASRSDAGLTTLVLGNLGISATTIPAASYTALATAVTTLFGTYGLAGRGQIILNMSQLLANLEGDATYGTVATTYNTTSLSNLTYASTSTNTSPGVQTTTPVSTTGTAFTLTAATNSFSGTAYADSFDGSLNTNGGQTLGSTDVLAGGLGTDSLYAALVNASTVSPTVSAIEEVTITATGAATLSMLNATGVTSVIVSGSSTAPSVTNMNSTSIALSVVDQAVGATFGYQTAVVSGSADSATLTLSNVTAGTVTVPGIETLSIVSSGSANAPTAITAAAATTLNISGSIALNLGTALAGTLQTSTKVTKVDGSTMTAALTAIAGAADTVLASVFGGSGNDAITVDAYALSAVSISGGAGDDSVTFGTTNTIASTDSVDGGAGNDTLVINAASAPSTAATALSLVTNFEYLTVSDALDNATSATLTTAYVQSGISKVTVAAANVAASTLTLEAGTKTVSYTAAQAAGLTINDTGTATTDSLTISNGIAATNALGGVALTLGGWETVTISDTGSGAATAQTIGTIGLTPDTGGSETLNFTGTNNLSVGVITATSAATLSIDASGMSGTATFTQTGAPIRATITTGATTITGTANADTLYAATTGTTVSGGAGNDTIYGGSANDSLSGGAGNDLFAMTTVLTSADTIVGGDGTDILNLTAVTVPDSYFTSVSSVETLTLLGSTTAVTLGALSGAAGVATVTLGSSTDATIEQLTVPSTFTGATLAVNAYDGSVDTLSASGYTGTLTMTAYNTLDGGTYTGGAGTADSIVYNLSSASITQAANASITLFEKVSASGSTTNNLSLTLADANIASLKTMTIDGSSLTTGTLTVDATLETNGYVVVTGGTGADTVNGSASIYGDNLSGGTGADTFVMAGNLASTDTIAGGDGTDVLSVSGTVADAAFTNISSVASLKGAGATVTTGAASDITLGALAMAAGITTLSDAAASTANVWRVGSGFTSALAATVRGGDGDSVIATSYTGALTVSTVTATTIGATDTITGGTSTGDILRFTLTGSSVTETAANLANVTAVETWNTTGVTTNSLSLTLANVNIAADKSLTIDGSSLTSGILTVVGTLETNGALIVVGGGADDLITGTASTYGDNLSGGSGNDTFTFATANFTALDTVAGGAGSTDTISISDASTVIDSGFTYVSGVEVMTGSAAQTITLGALAMASGLTTITGATGFVENITVGAGFTSALAITLSSATDALADVVTGSASAAALTITTSMPGTTSADTISGGTSTSDKLIFSDAGTADLTYVSGIETITFTTAAGAHTITTAQATVASGKTLTVDGSTITGTLNFNSVALTLAETNGYYSITGGTGADSLFGGALADTISGGTGADSIHGGLGADVMSGGSDTAKDIFFYSGVGFETGTISPSVLYYGGVVTAGVSVSTAALDKILDFTTYDTIQTNATGGSMTSTTGTNATGAAWTQGNGFLRGTYSSADSTFVFSTTGADSIFAYDFDGSTATADMRGIVLVAYYDATAIATITTGLVGGA